MKLIRPGFVSFAFFLAALNVRPAAAADQFFIEVRETAGIRRFGYPVAAELRLDPAVPVSTRFRLLQDDKPIVAQFRPIQRENDRIKSVALDFDGNFMPNESREYVVEFGPDVTPVPEPASGMKVDETDDEFIVSHGPNLTWTIPKNGVGLIRSVKTPKTDYVRPDSAGLFISPKHESVRFLVGKFCQANAEPQARIVKNGPIDCTIRFHSSDFFSGLKYESEVELDFPRSKSWVRVTFVAHLPAEVVAGLGADLSLNLAGEPALVDFGAGSPVYATLARGQVARLEAGLGPKRIIGSVNIPQRPYWRVDLGQSEKLEPFVLGLQPCDRAAEGWFHVMDRERCTAAAVARFGRATTDRIDVAADGRLQLTRDFKADLPPNGTPSLQFWLHFVPFPPHVGAVTSPQSMLSPLEVNVRARDEERRAESRQTNGNSGDEVNDKRALEVESLKARANAALAKTTGDIQVAGLKDKVEVLRDQWGVPHIYAENRDDLFFAQGFVQAQDRLWQMEIWRRATEGRLAEIVGPDAVDRDRFARLVRFRGDAEAEWTSYSHDARQIIEAFVRGVNACIELSQDNLPIEFQLTGIRPEPWTHDVCIGRMAGFIMCRNASNEVLRAQLVREVGADEAAKLLPIDPKHEIKVPDGLELDGIDHRIVAGINSANAAIRVPLKDDQVPLDKTDAGNERLESALRSADSEWLDVGSNNWTIAGRLTATGGPILANDPHRPITLPSLRYLIHLHCPPRGNDRGWNVIGGTEPALPGVAIGHNDRVAWGMTIVGTDQMDIYVEDAHADDPNRYRAGDEWRSMRVEREEIRVRGEPAPRVVELKFTRHGPVIFEDRERRRAYALKWTGSEPGTAGYLAALALDRTRNWPEFLEGAARWKLPSENLVYADVDGHIGWIAAALTPIRRGWDGLLPVPGASGEFEWDGFLPVAELPQRFDSPEGYIATANHNILPRGYRREISYEWSAPFRFGRIDEVFRGRIQAGHRFSVADSERLQHDATSIPARRLLTLLRGVVEDTSYRGPAVDSRLLRWDAVLARDSGAAAIFEAWQRVLGERVLRPRVPEKLWERYAGRLPLQAALELLERPDASFGDDPLAGRNKLLIDSLMDAIRDLQKQLGDDPAKWRWDALHQAHFTHMLATPVRTARQVSRDGGREENDRAKASVTDRSAIAAAFNLPAVPRGGDAYTPLATGGPSHGNLTQTTGASYRQVIDLADWDRSVATSVPGQSGQPGSRHYADLVPLWADGEYFPLVFSRAAVEAATTERLELLPSESRKK